MVTFWSTSVMDSDKNSYSFCWFWPVLNITAVFLCCSLWHDVRVSLYTLAQSRGTWRCLSFLLIVNVYMYSYPIVTCVHEWLYVCTHIYVYIYVQYVYTRSVPVPLVTSVLQSSMSCGFQSRSSLSVRCGE